MSKETFWFYLWFVVAAAGVALFDYTSFAPVVLAAGCFYWGYFSRVLVEKEQEKRGARVNKKKKEKRRKPTKRWSW